MKNIKVLGIQFLVIVIIGSVLEILFDLPEWVSIILGALFFWSFFMIIQIKMGVKYSSDRVTRDGVAGARLCGIFITSMTMPFILGIYEHIVIDILFVIIGLIGILISGKNFWRFLFENNWEKIYWLVYWGCVLIFSGVYSLFAAYDIAPCTVLDLKYRIIALFLFGIIFLASIPLDSVLAKFASANYERY